MWFNNISVQVYNRIESDTRTRTFFYNVYRNREEERVKRIGYDTWIIRQLVVNINNYYLILIISLIRDSFSDLPHCFCFIGQFGYQGVIILSFVGSNK